MLILLSKEHQVLTTSQNEGEKPLILTRPRQNYFYKLLKYTGLPQRGIQTSRWEVIGATNKELLKSTSLAYLEARMGDKCPSGYALTTRWCSDWNIEFRWYQRHSDRYWNARWLKILIMDAKSFINIQSLVLMLKLLFIQNHPIQANIK
jgi:hypothetical protein